MSALKDIYVQGETVTFTAPDADYAAVTVCYGVKSAEMVLANGVWSATVQTKGITGRVNWAIFADGAVIDRGSFAVCVLHSVYRKAVEAIDAAMQKNAANGKYSMSVGEINLIDKTFDEMMKWRAYYEALAAAQESGDPLLLGPVRREVAFE